ncbi:MAG: SPASM domain-containing protein [Magnetococcales bacterium]|nr:SPASM domain-containing protein [Magnetococcales bacterium]
MQNREATFQNDAFTKAVSTLLKDSQYAKARDLALNLLKTNPTHIQALYTQLYCDYFLHELEKIINSSSTLLGYLNDTLQTPSLNKEHLLICVKISQQIVEITSKSSITLQIINNAEIQHVLVKLGFLAAKLATVFNKMAGNISAANSIESDFIARIFSYKNESSDDCLYYRHNSPAIIQVEPTNSCNLQCVMCTRNEMVREEGLLAEEVFEKIISSWSGIKDISTLPYIYDVTIENTIITPGLIKFYFLGEPLLNKNIYQYINHAKARGAEVGIQTNAVLLSDPNVRKKLLMAAPNIIGISLDGISPESFEAIRIGSSWSKTVKALEAFHKEREEEGLAKKVLLNISTIFPDDSLESRNKIINFLQEVKPYVDQLSMIKLGRSYDQDFFTKDGTMQTYKKLQEGETLTPKCQEPLYKLNILWDGTITPCCADINSNIPLGNIKNNGLDAVWNSPETTDHIKALLHNNLEKYQECITCVGSGAD